MDNVLYKVRYANGIHTHGKIKQSGKSLIVTKFLCLKRNILVCETIYTTYPVYEALKRLAKKASLFWKILKKIQKQIVTKSLKFSTKANSVPLLKHTAFANSAARALNNN